MSDRLRHWSKRGFNRAIYGSITVEINRQLGELRRRGLEPALIRLGPHASIKYAWEQWVPEARIELAPKEHKWAYGTVPIRYRDPKVSGVVVEGLRQGAP